MARPQIDQGDTWHYTGRNTTVGSFLKKQRMMRGLSRHSLAVVSGIQERRLEALELNQSPPSCQDIKNLAIVFEIPERQLLEAAGYVKPENGV